MATADIDESFLKTRQCRHSIIPIQLKQLLRAQQACCIIDNTRAGFLLGSNTVITTRHGEQSPEQLSTMSVEFPEALNGAFTIEPSIDDGRSGYYVPGSDFDTS